MKINYIIIDDEPIAHKIIENFASDLPSLNLTGNCYNAVEAFDVLNQKPIDLIFLDIDMPRLKGFEFLRTLNHRPEVIVVSAHKEYALEGYELSISDYLLKPFRFERFLKAVQKVTEKLSSQSNTKQAELNDSFIIIKDEKKHHQVEHDDIIYIEASGNYSLVYLKNDRILSQMKISDFETILPAKKFVRTHRSFIVAVKQVKLYKSNEVHLDNKVIPVGRVYKKNVDLIRFKNG
jgi:DNA-binding LytR/AlgR family response regulator